MSLIGDVKCGRCDKHYSALRGRCPYCGARRGSAGKHAGDRDNMKGSMIIGAIFLAIVLIATAVLLVTSLKNAKDTPDGDTTGSSLPTEQDIVGIETAEPLPTPEPTPTPTPAPVLSSFAVTYGGRELLKDSTSGYYDVSAKVGETLTLKLKLTPDDVEDTEFNWESADVTIFEVVPELDGLTANITMLKKGTTRLVVTCGDIERIVTIRSR